MKFKSKQGSYQRQSKTTPDIEDVTSPFQSKVKRGQVWILRTLGNIETGQFQVQN